MISTGTTNTTAGGDITVSRWAELANRDRLIEGIEQVFFAASATQSFANAAARAAFRERWLGRYLEHDPEFVYVALRSAAHDQQNDGGVAGYLIGARDDPARAERFADLGYFQKLREASARFPAQLHVNLDESVRGRGIGGRLIAAFVGDLERAGVAGVHVVTGKGARNVAFYNRNGFQQVAQFDWDGKDLVMLGRALSPER